MDKDFYTTEEAATYLGVTVGRVRQMIVDGILQTERFGRAHMIGREALKAAEQRRTKPGPAPMAKADGTLKASKEKGRKK
jgi:site-specific DNA-methyltransferase (adenine-specific)